MDRWRASIERIGARFEDREVAVAAMQSLRDRFGLGISDIEVQALGSTRYEQPASGTLLAGRFSSTVGDEVVTMIRAGGGEIIERRFEPDPVAELETGSGTSSPSRPPPTLPTAGVRSGPGHPAGRRLDRRSSRDRWSSDRSSSDRWSAERDPVRDPQ